MKYNNAVAGYNQTNIGLKHNTFAGAEGSITKVIIRLI